MIATIRFSTLVIILISLLFLIINPVIASENSEEGVTIEFYYFNACASCNIEEALRTEIWDILLSEGIDSGYLTIGKNTLTTEGTEALKSICALLNFEITSSDLPVIIIGNEWIKHSDWSEYLPEAFARIKMALEMRIEPDNTEVTGDVSDDITNIELETEAYTVTINTDEADTLLIFTTSFCDLCETAKIELSHFLAKHPNIKIIELDITQEDNVIVARQYLSAFFVPEKNWSIPAVFFSGGYLLGEDITVQNLVASSYLMNGSFSVSGDSSRTPGAEMSGSVFVAIFNGILGGLNPCSLSLLFLLLSVLLSDSSKSVWKVGLTYLLGKGIAYILLGTVLYRFISYLDNNTFLTVAELFKYLLSVVATLLAGMYFLDFLSARQGRYDKIRMQLPSWLKRMNNRLIISISKRASSPFFLPVILVFGILIAFSEFLCTGQVYLATILYVIKNGADTVRAVLFFSIYVLFMFLVPVATIAALKKGFSILEVSEFTRKRMPIVKLFYCSAFLLYALLTVLPN